ncbi:MAG TPA: hypothetical protein VEC96_11270, partial [Anaerolineae bacterium]|nr:hypothetical protein [Anaerolineae bacterium]
MPPKQWSFAPDSGGMKIPEAVKPRELSTLPAPLQHQLPQAVTNSLQVKAAHLSLVEKKIGAERGQDSINQV